MLNVSNLTRFHSAVRALAAAAVLAVLACAGACTPQSVPQETTDMTSYRDVPDSAWAQLRGRRIWFGHQSVGADIMQGVSDLVARDPKLGLTLTEGAPPESGAVFAHSTVGRNGDPSLKSDDFARVLDAGAGARLDVAFHKYCFADIVDTTDVERVFAHYRETMAGLESRFPTVTFVHVTAPLTMVQAGPRAALKKLMGQAPGRYASNFRRERFNQLMRAEYGSTGRLFDLAALESTRPDGTRETIALGGKTAFALHPGFSADGSHLNAAGRQRVAEELLALLARLSATP